VSSEQLKHIHYFTTHYSLQMPDLAVIMSIYHNDRLAFLKESVQSILDQTYSNFHYFLVFDGPVSQDIDEYVTSLPDERIRLSRLEKNGGLASALNYLLELLLKNPEYKFIARMDADDISMPIRFEKQRNFLLSHSEVSVVGCMYEEIDTNGGHLSYKRLPVEHEDLRKRYFIRTPFAHPSVIYKRELIEKAGFYPTNTVLMEDNVLWGKALKSGLRFANIPEYMLKFRIDKNYFKRRSGIRYGWNFINKRIEICKSLNSPLFFYIVAILIGIFKMSPSLTLKYIYVIANKISFTYVSL
jgi:glycosyltransferase involved in cell wall biosynthesis